MHQKKIHLHQKDNQKGGKEGSREGTKEGRDEGSMEGRKYIMKEATLPISGHFDRSGGADPLSLKLGPKSGMY